MPRPKVSSPSHDLGQEGPIPEFVLDLIRSRNSEWKEQATALQHVSKRALEIAQRPSSAEYRALLHQIRILAPSFNDLIGTLRSSFFRVICDTLEELAEGLGPSFVAIVDKHVIPALLKRVSTTKAVVRESAIGAAEALFYHGMSGISDKVASQIVQIIEDKKSSPSMREAAAKFVGLFLSDSKNTPSKSIQQALERAIVSGVSDPNEKVRAESRGNWLALAKVDELAASTLLQAMPSNIGSTLKEDFEDQHARRISQPPVSDSSPQLPDRSQTAYRVPRRGFEHPPSVQNEHFIPQSASNTTTATQQPSAHPSKLHLPSPTRPYIPDAQNAPLPHEPLQSNHVPKKSRPFLRPPRRSVAPVNTLKRTNAMNHHYSLNSRAEHNKTATVSSRLPESDSERGSKISSLHPKPKLNPSIVNDETNSSLYNRKDKDIASSIENGLNAPGVLNSSESSTSSSDTSNTTSPEKDTSQMEGAHFISSKSNVSPRQIPSFAHLALESNQSVDQKDGVNMRAGLVMSEIPPAFAISSHGTFSLANESESDNNICVQPDTKGGLKRQESIEEKNYISHQNDRYTTGVDQLNRQESITVNINESDKIKSIRNVGPNQKVEPDSRVSLAANEQTATSSRTSFPPSIQMECAHVQPMKSIPAPQDVGSIKTKDSSCSSTLKEKLGKHGAPSNPLVTPNMSSLPESTAVNSSRKSLDSPAKETRIAETKDVAQEGTSEAETSSKSSGSERSTVSSSKRSSSPPSNLPALKTPETSPTAPGPNAVNKGRLSFILGVNVTPGGMAGRSQWAHSRFDVSSPLISSTPESGGRRSGDIGLSVALVEESESTDSSRERSKRGIVAPDLDTDNDSPLRPSSGAESSTSSTLRNERPVQDSFAIGMTDPPTTVTSHENATRVTGPLVVVPEEDPKDVPDKQTIESDKPSVQEVTEHIGSDGSVNSVENPAAAVQPGPLPESSKHVKDKNEDVTSTQNSAVRSKMSRVEGSLPRASTGNVPKTISGNKPRTFTTSIPKISTKVTSEALIGNAPNTSSSANGPKPPTGSLRESSIVKQMRSGEIKHFPGKLTIAKTKSAEKENDGTRIGARRPPIASLSRKSSMHTVSDSGTSSKILRRGSRTSMAPLAQASKIKVGTGGAAPGLAYSAKTPLPEGLKDRRASVAVGVPGSGTGASSQNAIVPKKRTLRASSAIGNLFSKTSSTDIAEDSSKDKLSANVRRTLSATSSGVRPLQIGKEGANDRQLNKGKATGPGRSTTAVAKLMLKPPTGAGTVATSRKPTHTIPGRDSNTTSGPKPNSSSGARVGGASRAAGLNGNDAIKNEVNSIEILRSSLAKLRGGRGDWRSRIEKMNDVKNELEGLSRSDLNVTLTEECLAVIGEAMNDIHQKMTGLALDCLFLVLLRTEGEEESAALQRLLEKRVDVLRRVLHLCKENKEDVRLAGQRVLTSFEVQFAAEVQVGLLLRAMGIEHGKARHRMGSRSGSVTTTYGSGLADARVMEVGCIAMGNAIERAESCEGGFVWSGNNLEAILVSMSKLAKDRRVGVRRAADGVMQAIQRHLPENTFSLACRKFGVQWNNNTLEK